MGKILKLFFSCLILLGWFLVFPQTVRAATKAIIGRATVANSGKYLDFTNYSANVTVETTTGIFSGYAFLEEAGWVAFGTTDNSEGPVSYNTDTGVVSGKAKILTTGAYLDFDSYNSNVSLNPVTGVFSGYVFSLELGWINFGDPGVSWTEAATVSSSLRSLSGRAQVLNSGAYLDFSNYQANVKVDNTTGNFSGYAFLEEAGWVAFGTTDNSEGPVNLNLTTGVVTGKAKVLNTGAYLDFDSYNSNVKATLPGGVFSGYVFSTELGWINFGDPGVSATSSFDNTAPTITLTPLSPDPTNNNKPVIDGKATDAAGTVVSVSYQMDGTNADWLACTADDGAFDESEELFHCTITSALSDGSHTIYVRATDSNANTTPSGSEATVSFTVDTQNPTTFSLQSPDNDSYTNAERPVFKWKTAQNSDLTTGLQKYKLEVDNGDKEDFTIDEISPEKTTDEDKEKYYIRYEGFNDSDGTNNYISVWTKDSSLWRPEENWGKLKAGKRTWKVIAFDKAGNSKEEKRTLFVDRKKPELSKLKLNQTSLGGNLTTFDQKPTLSGWVLDKLSEEGEDRLAAGPKFLKISIERQNWTGNFSFYSLIEINFQKIYYAGINKEIEDLSKNLNDKYAEFAYQLSEPLPYGHYRFTLEGQDRAGNQSEAVIFRLTLLPWEEFKELPETKEFVEELTKETNIPQETVTKVIEEQKIALPTILPKLNFFSQFLSQVSGRLSKLYWQAIEGGKKRITMTEKGIGLILASLSKVQFPMVKMPYLTSFPLPRLPSWSWQPPLLVTEFTHKLVILADTFNMLFLDREPTKITNVKIEKISATTVEISWETNHYATAKINYGTSRSYGEEKHQDKLAKKHRFILTDLKPNTTYYFEVMSQGKNYAYDAYYEFTTPPLEKTVP